MTYASFMVGATFLPGVSMGFASAFKLLPSWMGVAFQWLVDLPKLFDM
jgi:hypothetical protein